jgi:hypothetical protein
LYLGKCRCCGSLRVVRRALLIFLLSGIIASCSKGPPEPDAAPSCVDEKLVAALFKEIRRKGAWDLEEPLLWAYYFESREQAPLVELRDALQPSGYQFVELMGPEREGDVYVLHVSRIEKHSAASLKARNRKLCVLAKKTKAASYKGMDVGPVPEDAR